VRVASKLAIGASLPILLVLSALAYNLKITRDAVEVSRKLIQYKFQMIDEIGDLGLDLNGLEEQTRRLLLLQDEKDAQLRPQLISDIRTRREDIRKRLDAIRALREISADEAAAFDVLSRRWQRLHADLTPWLDPKPTRSADEVTAAQDGFKAGFDELKALLTALQAATRNASSAGVESSRSAYVQARSLATSLTFLAVLLSALIILMTVRSIHEPLKRLDTATHAVAHGNFEVRLDDSSGDEFARLASSFNAMVGRLSELDGMKRDFVAHVSHELRNPLVAMQETNQLMIDELAGPLTEKQRRMLQLNIDSGRRLSAMISNLLDLSSLEAGVMTYEFKQVDLTELVRSVATQFEGRMVERRVQLRLDPSIGQPVRAPGDRDRLLQVLENLLDNALKFSPQGGRIEVSLHVLAKLPKPLPPYLAGRLVNEGRGRPFVLLSVADGGPGVPDEQKEPIFRKFHQVGRGARTRGSGVGLGLAICSEIVSAHDGAIWVADRRGGGSIFSVLLPGPAKLDPSVALAPVPYEQESMS
jgi:signal transduction histidine kinase